MVFCIWIHGFYICKAISRKLYRSPLAIFLSMYIAKNRTKNLNIKLNLSSIEWCTESCGGKVRCREARPGWQGVGVSRNKKRSQLDPWGTRRSRRERPSVLMLMLMAVEGWRRRTKPESFRSQAAAFLLCNPHRNQLSVTSCETRPLRSVDIILTSRCHGGQWNKTKRGWGINRY